SGSGTNEGALLEFAREHVGMHMEDRLADARAVIKDETELAVASLRSDSLSHGHHFCERLRLRCCEFFDVRILRALRNHDHVQRRLRSNIWEGDDTIGLHEDLDRDLTRDDLAEYGFFSHAIQSTAAVRALPSRYLKFALASFRISLSEWNRIAQVRR